MTRPSKVLHAAAQRVFREEDFNDGGCWAIAFVVDPAFRDLRTSPSCGLYGLDGTSGEQRPSAPLYQRSMSYFELMKPPEDEDDMPAYWFDDQEHRIMALLMASVIAESEGQ